MKKINTIDRKNLNEKSKKKNIQINLKKHINKK